MTKPISHLHVFAINSSSPKGRLVIGQLSFPCLLGKKGRTHFKREGDSKSPMGKWRLEKLHYRPDKMVHIKQGTALKQSMGWCDAKSHRLYNRAVKLPFTESHEDMWRKDEAYDVVVTTNHNQKPRIKGLGSAIFMHVIRKGATGTEGCIALSEKHLKIILSLCTKNAVLVI